MFGFFDDPSPDQDLYSGVLELSEQALADGLSRTQTALALINFAIAAAYLVLTPDEVRAALDHALEREARDVGRGGDKMAHVFLRCPFESESDGERCKRCVHGEAEPHDFINWEKPLK